jgi:hypothetical protein
MTNLQPKTPEEEIRRAEEARTILSSPVFVEARERLEGYLSAQRRKVPIRDSDMHTKLILMEQLWSQITDYLEQLSQTGKFAELELRRRENVFEMMKQGFRR